MHIKRATKSLMLEKDGFSGDFKENKKVLEAYTFPDKGTRNKIAGYIVRLKKAGDVPKPRSIKTESE